MNIYIIVMNYKDLRDRLFKINQFVYMIYYIYVFEFMKILIFYISLFVFENKILYILKKKIIKIIGK